MTICPILIGHLQKLPKTGGDLPAQMGATSGTGIIVRALRCLTGMETDTKVVTK